MSPITINLDGVEPWKGGSVLPPGRYLCRCTDAEEGRSKGGHFEVHLTWEATTGEHTGGQIQDWVQVTESSLGKVRQLLEAARISIPSGEFSLTAQQFRGATAEVVVREGTKQDGTPRMEVAAYNPPPGQSDVPGARAGEFVHTGAAAGNSAQADDPPPF
jgi:hypothetical protein